jgi:5-methyltetrahydropteroyltriglutamate--homocysteine methyltransferase
LSFFIPRAEIVGSLKRSMRLVAANERAYDQGHVSVHCTERKRGLAEVFRIADEEIPKVVARQIDIGLDVVSDGELRRFMFLNSLFDGLEGFSTERAKVRFRAADGTSLDWSMQLVTDRLRQVGSPAAGEAAVMRRTTDHLFKVTFPAASFFALPFNWRIGVNDHAYGSLRELVEHAVEIERRMIAEAVAAGCRYIQLDFPTYPLLCDRGWIERIERAGFSAEETLDLCEWADREVIAGVPEHVRTAIHLCRGNNQNYYVAEGAFDPVAERFFSLPYDSFLVEWNDPVRMGDFSALRYLPDGHSVVVMGLVNTKRAELETRDDIMRQLDAAARYACPERLAISTQCGFASTLKGNAITEEQQWKKLELVADVAHAYWGLRESVDVHRHQRVEYSF